jgi:hypothetical protein
MRSDDSVLCMACERGITIEAWPEHARRHDPSVFCGVGTPGMSALIVCRRPFGHPGQHAGALGLLRWTLKEEGEPVLS